MIFFCYVTYIILPAHDVACSLLFATKRLLLNKTIDSSLSFIKGIERHTQFSNGYNWLLYSIIWLLSDSNFPEVYSSVQLIFMEYGIIIGNSMGLGVSGFLFKKHSEQIYKCPHTSRRQTKFNTFIEVPIITAQNNWVDFNRKGETTRLLRQWSGVPNSGIWNAKARQQSCL